MKKPLPIIENVEITDFAAEGKSIARVEDKVIFVPFTIPGDVVDIQIVKRRRAYSEGRVVRYVRYSAVRQAPACQHFGICGGCKWQMLPYEEQLKMKQQQVLDQLTRIGKIPLPPFRQILGSPQTYEYRNKLEFGCSDRRWLTPEQIASKQDVNTGNGIGFHITGVFDKILPINRCHLMHPLHNDIRNAVFTYAESMGMTFYNARSGQGLLRDIILRNSNNGEWMLTVQFNIKQDGDRQQAMTLMQQIKEQFPQLTSILWVDNQKCNDTFNDLPVHAFHGKMYITAQMENLQFRIGPKSFYQTNTEQAYRLYSVVREMADLKGAETVYDLYTGTGTIAQFIARGAGKVVGIEYVEDAIADAKENARLNQIDNVSFYAGDMKDILTPAFIAQHGKPDIIITDPPRAGMHPKVVETLLNTAAKRIIYVSCNPATQARDLQLLAQQYRVVEVQPVDMFPHTPHVENVVVLELTCPATKTDMIGHQN